MNDKETIPFTMEIAMFRFSIGMLLVLITVTFSPVDGKHLLELTPTPISDPELVSAPLFSQDTCLPPCWFGLVAGESTSQDVARLVNSNSDIFDRWDTSPRSTFEPTTNDMINGRYTFYWTDYQPPNTDQVLQVNSTLFIEDQLVQQMQIVMNEDIRLDDVLQRLSNPDYIYFSTFFEQPIMILDYLDLQMSVWLIGPETNCTLMNLTERLWVEQVIYYAEGELQERDLTNVGIYFVPSDTWLTWINDEVDSTCDEVIAELEQIPNNTLPK